MLASDLSFFFVHYLLVSISVMTQQKKKSVRHSIENLLNQDSYDNSKGVGLSYTSYQDKTMESFDIFQFQV